MESHLWVGVRERLIYDVCVRPVVYTLEPENGGAANGGVGVRGAQYQKRRGALYEEP